MVLKFSESLLHKDYILWIHNYNNCPTLAKFLKSHMMDGVETITTNKKLKMKTARKQAVQHSGPVCILRWCDKKHVAMISTYNTAEVHKVIKRRIRKQKPVCVVHYNQHRGGADKEDHLLKMYLVERKRMNQRYTKLFRSTTSTMVLNSLVIYRTNTGWKLHHLTLRINLVGSFLLKYSVQHKVSGHHGGDNTIKWMRECHVTRIIPPTEKIL
ncbi:hypothetical protein Cfor_03130 [Coptotermes formosanus]|uniref:PiggyBac transposable element-derived protein domain-containing protein n=1 Tax=Coptotermes formosanus TaxID=36987 RepID=A0A6L2QFG0_COPFO|nr:hypothetical protein Cfor_03130 [Coptotermes formosanus]